MRLEPSSDCRPSRSAIAAPLAVVGDQVDPLAVADLVERQAVGETSVIRSSLPQSPSIGAASSRAHSARSGRGDASARPRRAAPSR